MLGTIGLLGPISQLHALDESVASVVLLVGLAVGVDYSMFYLRREMEERDAGRGHEAALEAAAATSGRAVLISGLTVMAAMAGMFLAGNAVFVSFGIGTILVVAVAMLGSLTVLPAMLSLLGAKGWTEKGRVPWVAKRRHKTGGESRVWGAILDRVLKRPLVSVDPGRRPARRARRSRPSRCTPSTRASTGLPRDLAGHADLRQDPGRVPRRRVPAVTVVKAADVTTPEVKARDRRISSTRRSPPASCPSRSTSRSTPTRRSRRSSIGGARATAPTPLRPLARRPAREVVPATVGQAAGAEVAVTGFTAGSKDFNDAMKSHLPIVFAFVLTLAFILLLVTFRSIVVPIKAIVLNLLSVGAAYGVLMLVFQDGRLEGLLGYQSVGGITSWLPLFLFVILFGLSMDYHVFILSRIREAVDRGMRTDRGGRARDQEHGRRRDQRGRGDGRRVRDLRDAVHARVQADGRRPRGRDPDRRDDRPRGAAAGDDEAARRAQLVPAEQLNWLPKFEHEVEPAKA